MAGRAEASYAIRLLELLADEEGPGLNLEFAMTSPDWYMMWGVGAFHPYHHLDQDEEGSDEEGSDEEEEEELEEEELEEEESEEEESEEEESEEEESEEEESEEE